MVDRRSLTMRDMALAVGVLVVSLVVVLGAMGNLGFGSNTDNGATPTADVTGGLQRAAAALDLPIEVPAGLPADWHPSSFTQVTPFTDGGTRTVVRAGWITPSGAFVTLIQSPESAQDLVTHEIGRGLALLGTVQAGGAEWNIYPGQRQEPAWVRSTGVLTLLISGSATEADFQTLAAGIT